MEESILTSIKKMLGLSDDYTAFDVDIVTHINSALMVLSQIGVGPNAFTITGPTETWKDLIGDARSLQLVKTYVYLKVRLLFDPPSVGSVVSSYEKQIQEYEWRLQVQAEEVRGYAGLFE